MRLDHFPQWLWINTNHSKPRNFVTPWKEADGVGGWWFAWLTPWSSARAFLDISTAIVRKKEREIERRKVSKYCLQWGLRTLTGQWTLAEPSLVVQLLVSITLHSPQSTLFPSMANFSTKSGCLNLTLSQLLDNKESVQWSEEWLTVVTIGGTLTGSFLAGN